MLIIKNLIFYQITYHSSYLCFVLYQPIIYQSMQQLQNPQTPELITQQQLKSILQQGVGEIITVFSKQSYRIEPIRQSLVRQIQSLCHSKTPKDQHEKHQSYILDMVDKVSIFLWVLAKASGVWIAMLNDQKLISESTELDLYLFTSKVYKRLLIEGRVYLPQFGKYCDLASKAIIHYLEFISNQITGVYNVNKKLVVEEIDELNTDTKQMKLLNKFMVFKLLKQLNEELKQKIKKNIQNSIFCYVDPDQIDIFINYIIDKHDIISFVFAKDKDKDRQNKGNTIIPLEDQLVEKVLMLGSNMKRIHYRQAMREDGKKAIFIQIEKGIQEEENIQSYLITVDDSDDDELVVYNPAFTRKKWEIEDRASQDQSIDELVKSKQGIVKSMRGAPNEVKVMPKNAHTIGGSLGNCLADLNKYDSFQSFLTDFSKKAVISTSLNFVVSNIPLIGYILVTGGFSLTFYNLFRNDFKNGQRKAEDLGQMILGSTTSIGTGFIGGLIGSAFIPIPVLGFFLGGLVGGFVGGVTSNVIEKSLSSAKFIEIVRVLESNMDKTGADIGSWQVNKKIIKSLGTTLDYFLIHIPTNLQSRVGCDRHWLALIGFSILTFHQTNLQMKKQQKRMKQLQNIKQTELQEIKVSPYLEMSLGYLEKTRIDLRPNIQHLQLFFKQMFSSA